MNPPTPIDPRVIHDILLISTLCVGMITPGATLIGAIAFYRVQRGAAKTFSLLIQRADATRLVAFLSIVVAACLLALIGRINSEAVVAILSGIAGYVLGGANARKAHDEDDNDNQPSSSK